MQYSMRPNAISVSLNTVNKTRTFELCFAKKNEMIRKKDLFILMNETQRSESVKWSELSITTRIIQTVMCLWFKHTPHQKHGMSQSMTNASKSQWAFDYPPVNLLFGAATFEFVTSASVSAGFAVYSHWTRCSGRRWRSPNEGLDLDLFLAVVWILKIWITSHK